MPNGGTDCCALCEFASGLDTDSARCEIRDTEIEHAHWTYCANHPRNNPEKIRTPVGPIYEDAGDYPYRREVLVPRRRRPVEEKLRLLERLVRGELDTTSRIFQVELIMDLEKSRSEEMIPRLFDVVVSEPGDLTLTPYVEPTPGVVDLATAWDTRSARTYFVRHAAMKVLRHLYNDGDNGVIEELGRRWKSASLQQRGWLNLAHVFIIAYEEPP